MALTESCDSSYNNPHLIVWEKVYINTSRPIIFFNLYGLFLEYMLSPVRHIPTYKGLHPGIPKLGNIYTTDIRSTCALPQHISAANTVNGRVINIIFGMVYNSNCYQSALFFKRLLCRAPYDGK